MHLVQERPPQDCGDKRVIYCDGGDGQHPALGHPRIFINLLRSVLRTFWIFGMMRILSSSGNLCKFDPSFDKIA
ncbi:unnamed protein product [Cylicostephanus goldi]|uniref:Zinc finger CHCC-type domain-containing protein n=1 Tax=Cylicostephanus goldi TaxID=71465 RepID=A0A3P7MGD7_CYLGO|nr:unnamed protein product [Cylicostephanus goldi]